LFHSLPFLSARLCFKSGGQKSLLPRIECSSNNVIDRPRHHFSCKLNHTVKRGAPKVAPRYSSLGYRYSDKKSKPSATPVGVFTRVRERGCEVDLFATDDSEHSPIRRQKASEKGVFYTVSFGGGRRSQIESRGSPYLRSLPAPSRRLVIYIGNAED
jgi:hypothetical protein